MAGDAARVALVGLPGSGKSAVAQALARRLGWRLADTDAIVEAAAGRTVAEVFAAEGEEGFRHRTNRQGGLTGGVTDGEEVWAQVYFKPISTLLKPLRSVDLVSRQEINAHYERSDICVVPAGGVVAEAMMAWVLAAAVMDKFGGDSLAELRRAVAAHRRRMRAGGSAGTPRGAAAPAPAAAEA